MDSPPTTPIRNSPNSASPGNPEQSTGAVIGIIIVIILLGAGAFYVWSNNLEMGGNNPNASLNAAYDQAASPSGARNAQSNSQGALDPATESLKQVRSSDSSSAIDADLQSTNTGNLDADLSKSGSQI